jgi:chromosome segregation ATPase
MNDLKQQVKKLQEEVNKTMKMYEGYKKDVRNKVPETSVTSKIKYLENEIQHLKDKKKELTDTLEMTERKVSEICDQTNEMKKEQAKLAEKYGRKLRGKMEISL